MSECVCVRECSFLLDLHPLKGLLAVFYSSRSVSDSVRCILALVSHTECLETHVLSALTRVVSVLVQWQQLSDTCFTRIPHVQKQSLLLV